MVRGYAFRAWNKQLQQMKPVLAIDLDPEFGGVFVWGKASVDFTTGEHEADKDFWPWRDIELMQCAELPDKDRKDIFEGDIVSHFHHSIKFIVQWCSGIGERLGSEVGWMLDNGYYTVEFTACQTLSCACNHDHLDGVVLGNIYENPELLQDMGSFGYDPLTGVQKI